MSARGTSLYFSIDDKGSMVLTTLADKTKALDKETQSLALSYQALQKNNQPLIQQQSELKASLEKQKLTVSELRKEYQKYGDDMSGLKMQLAIKEQDNLKQKLKDVEDQLKLNRKSFNEQREEIRKGTLEAETGGGLGSGGSSLGGLLTKLGVADKISSLLQKAGGAFLTSALGSDMGGAVSGALSSALSGAMLGQTILPGVGALVGGAVGGVSSLMGSAMEHWEKTDDAFKDYYGGLYDNVKGKSGEMLSSGSTIASGRKTNLISFQTMFKDEKTASTYLDDLVNMANRTPFLYDDLVAMSKTLATYGYSAEKDKEKKANNELDTGYLLDVLQVIGDTGAALGMSTSDMSSVAQALGRMRSSDKATLEYLNILNDRGIGAVGMLAEAKDKSQGEIYDAISKGEISGTEAVEIITKALREAYHDSMEEQSKTFAGVTSTLEGLNQEMENAGGKAYNDLRLGGLNEEVSALGGELGEALKEINAVLGENQARKENLEDQYMREVLTTVLTGNRGELWDSFSEDQQNKLTGLSEQYTEWKVQYEKSGRTDAEAAAQMESLYEQAQTLGKAYFDNSAEVQQLNEIEREEVEAIRENTAGLAAATEAYRMSQERSKGQMSTKEFQEDAKEAAWQGVQTGLIMANLVLSGNTDAAASILAENSHAYGLDRVPYDGYPALLHEGERVLTASEARAQDAGSGGVSVNIGSVTVGAQASTWDIAMAIAQELERYAVGLAPK